MQRSFESLLHLLDQISGEFRELREGVLKAIQVASIDPEMSLTRARKVLEHVVREVFFRCYDESPGTRPLENLLHDLVKDGHMPTRINAYASSVRMLGNVGTHAFGEAVTPADVYLALTQLLPVLEWYFSQRQARQQGRADPGPQQASVSGQPDELTTGPNVLSMSISEELQTDSRKIRAWLDPGMPTSIAAQKSDKIVVHTWPILDTAGGTYPMDYYSYETVSAFLADVWFLLASVIEPNRYGNSWVLRQRETFRVFDVGSAWAKSNGRLSDDRPLADAGLLPGMNVDTVPLP
jgi:hypothetical protein